MAYAFKAIRDALGQDQQQKTNIFSPTGTDQGTEDAAQMGGAMQPKTSTEGEGLMGGGTGQGESGDKTGASVAQQSSSRQALEKSAGKTQTPALIAKTQQGLSDADKAVQGEADSYVQNAKNTNYGVNDDQITRYVNGNEEGAPGAVAALRGRAAADRADPFRIKQDLSFNDVDQIQSDPGLEQVLRREGGQAYTAGMGAFDLAALKRSPGFDQIRGSLKQQKEDLLKRTGSLSADKTAEAQAALDANLKTAKEGLSSGLGQRQKDLMAAQDEEAKAANAAALAGRGQYSADRAKTLRQDFADQTGDQARLDEYLLNSGIDPSQFYSGTDATGADMIDQGEAGQFNRIMSALGKTDTYAAGRGGPKQGFDDQGYYNAVYGDATGRRDQRDRSINSDVNKWIADIKSRNNPDTERASEAKAIQDSLGNTFSDVYGDVSPTIDPNQFNRDVDWQSLITQDDLAKVNPLLQELGDQNTYGQFQPGQGAGPVGSFDDAAYAKALAEALAGKRGHNKTAKEAAEAEEARKRGDQTARIGGVATGVKNKDATAAGAANQQMARDEATPLAPAPEAVNQLQNAGRTLNKAINQPTPKRPRWG